ncbi:MAG: hypothetical protein ACI8ZO_001773 [Flavobacteriales bacterium]|jgi:hypothetical protein
MQKFHQYILKVTKASSIVKTELIQSLWSDYGQIVRVYLEGGKHSTVVVKHICIPSKTNHPRGWNTDLGHQRKVTSYQIENQWYQEWASRCNSNCQTPQLLGYQQIESEKLLILEDLDAKGFRVRKASLTVDQSKVVLKWLANFHATFMHEKPDGLWPTGTYWHLATRQEEWNAMPKSRLKEHAAIIDQQLNNSQYQTIVHGDAKVANFCFSSDLKSVAAVDFQYVGGGCGMKDVAYYIGSCLTEQECLKHETELLDYYFLELSKGLINHKPAINSEAVEAEYRFLYAIAWADFTRFLLGWNPKHWKLHSYSQKLSNNALNSLLS